jgi:translation initiation factor 1
MEAKSKRIGIVYSTNESFEYQTEKESIEETLSPEKQKLIVFKDSKQRKGKTVTIVSGFIGSENDMKDLAKFLKNKCGAGGSVKDKQIIVQGYFIDKIFNALIEKKYNVKKSGV